MSPGAPASTSLFLQPEWFALLARTGMDTSTKQLMIEADDARLHLVRKGAHFESCANFYSPLFGFENDARPSTAHIQQLAGSLRAAGARQICLRPMLADSSGLKSLRTGFEAAGFRCDTLPVSINWHLPCSGLSWNDYLAARPSRLRNTLQRCRKRLEGTSGFRLDIIDQAGPALDTALAAYQHIYAASWKEPEPFPDFIPDLCRMAAERGWLRLGVLHVEGEPAAAQLWFVKDGTASIYKLAYDSRFARLGVGTVLSGALFEQVLDVDKVSEIDFLTGDDAYKAEWMSHRRELLALLAFDTRSLHGQLLAARHFLPRRIKHALGR